MIKCKQIFFLILASAIIGCVNRTSSRSSNKTYKINYYSSGEVLSKGWYVNDTLPVDTIYEFYKNGNPLAISLYDSKGELNGISKTFFENGNVHQVNNYTNGLLQDFSYEYHERGTLDSKVFYLKGRQIGDYYGYNKNGILDRYAFYWDDTSYVCYIEYDTLGRIKDDANTRSALFSYKTLIDNNSNSENKIIKKFDIQIIASNPPKCSTKIYIDFRSLNNIIIKRDSIFNKSYSLRSYEFDDSVKVEYRAVQYDSSINKYYRFSL